MSICGDIDEANARIEDLEAEVARLNLQLGIAERKVAELLAAGHGIVRACDLSGFLTGHADRLYKLLKSMS